MMKMPFAWIPMVGALALAYSSLNAEPGAGEGPGKAPTNLEERSARMMERFKRELDLTPKQIEKIEQAASVERANMRKVREDSSLGREQKIEAMKASRARMDAAIREVLTEEQKVKFDQMIEKRKEMKRAQGQDGENKSLNR